MISRRWTENEVRTLLRMHDEGYAIRNICAALTRSDSAVRVKLLDLGRTSSRLTPQSSGDAPILSYDLSVSPDGVTDLELPTLPENEGTQIPPKAPAANLSETSVEEDLELGKTALHQAEARKVRSKYQELLRQIAVNDRVVELFSQSLRPFALAGDYFRPLPTVVSDDSSDDAQAAVLLLSDLHIGQHVSREQTNGFGDYCCYTYCCRLDYLVRTVERLLGPGAPCPTSELHVFLLGDIVHGMLMHGAEREETLLMADQFQLATWTLHQALHRLAKCVPQLQVHTVVGNHGRWPHQRKMPTVARYSNFDHLVYSALQHSFAAQGAGNVTFNLNTAPRQIVSIKGSTIMASHGDHLRGGDKQLAVPIHAIAREVNATAQRHAAAELPPVDYHLIGDKHKHISLPLARGGFLVNGSFVGVDEFGMGFPPVEPLQLLFWLHPKMRKTWEYAIKLLHAPKLDSIPFELPTNILHLVEDNAEEALSA